ncbi:YcaO-like family protein [Streptomyces sp. NPDC051320]|uniref:YcaO-like family protein n=1 Tax=Streptomyces sp. NPDC051320 TaxID=3154644 RepID=UPI00341B9EC7
MKQHEFLGYSSGVSVIADGDNLTFESAHVRARVRVPDTKLRKSLLQMAKRPLQPGDISDETLRFLRQHDLVTAAAHPAHLQALRVHTEASIPLNRGLAYSPDDLMTYQSRARTARFLPGSTSGGVDLPLPLRRRPSFAPFDGPRAQSLDAQTLTSVMRTLHDPDTRLYPSAGGLYPVRLIAEQVHEKHSGLTAFDPDRGALHTWTQALTDAQTRSLKLDPTLAAVPTRFWLVADIADTTSKYGSRGYRYALIEAGHAAQILIQTLGHSGADTRPFGGFDDAAMAAHLNLPSGWIPLCAVGALPRENRDDWVEAEEVRCTLVNKQPLYYAQAFGAKVKDQREGGFGVDTTIDGARLRARGELAERLTLVRATQRLGNSNGMAAHTRTSAATDAATLELYERHCYLRTWFLQASPVRLHVPDTPLASAVLSLCRSANAKLTLLDIADPLYGVSAAMAVVHSDEHGGIITASGAGADETEAASRALREIAKALFYRLILRKTSVFTARNPVADIITEPWEHEAYFAQEQVPSTTTRFLTDGAAERPLFTKPTALDSLHRVVEVQDLSAQGPDETSWKIARATSQHLLTVEFGTPSEAFRTRIRALLGDVDIDSLWPHPLG